MTTKQVSGSIPALFLMFSLFAAPARAQELPDGPGKDTFVKVCSACHAVDAPVGKRQDRDAWAAKVIQMVDFGAEATKDEREEIINYLTKNFGPGGTPTTPAETTKVSETTKVNVNKATAKDIESGLKLTTKQAEAVVEYREQHGKFKDWHDLLKVDGIDEKKIEDAKDRIITEDPDVPPRDR